MKDRLQKIRKLIVINKLDAILISSVPNIIYLTNYRGFSSVEREAYLLLTKNKNYLITDSRYSEAVKVLVPHFSLLEITHTTPLRDLIKQLIKKHRLKTVGFEHTNLTVAEYKSFRKFFKLKAVLLSGVRVQKTTEEISAIQNACKLADLAFLQILKHIRAGVTEKELAHILETFVRKEGHEMSFETIVAFGQNAATPHHQTSNTKLKRNNFVLLDFGVRFNHYCSDMTRTVFFGSANAEQRRMYETVLESQRLAIEQLNNLTMKKRKITGKQIDAIARSYIIDNKYPTIPHSLGHGIGIEVHEPPFLSPKSFATLEKDMVFSMEPGIYTSGFGGVRIEDLVVMERSGPRILTQAPKHFIEIK